MAVALWIVAVLVALLVIVLATPWRISLVAATRPHRQLVLAVAGLGGYGPTIRLVDSDRQRSSKEARKAKGREKKTAGGKRRVPFSAARSRWGRRVPSLIVDLLRQFRIDHVVAEGEFGLGDPASTGQLYGLLSPLIYAVPQGRRVHVNVWPRFDGPALEGRVDAAVAVVPVALLPPFLRFGWAVLRGGQST